MAKLGISLLYVEDEEYIRKNMVLSLQRRVETIYSAENGKDGLEKFIKHQPDLVITDIKMPIMNGLEMVKHIRKHKENTKIIMLSAHSDTKSLLGAIEIGVHGYILKPFQTDKLYKLIEELAKDIILDKTVKEQSKKINELYRALVKDLETAGSVQEYLLPDHLRIEPEIFFSSTYVPSSKIGGDLYDIIKLSNGKYITYVGDISGHGVKAALLMTAVKSTINRVIEDEGLTEPYDILNRLNGILSKELFRSDYMTLMVCYIDCFQKKLRFMNAGHPPLIIWDRRNEEITTIAPEGSIPIGWMQQYVYTPDEEYETEFDPEHLFFLYTDGLFECENEDGEELGLEGLKEFIQQSVQQNAKVLAPQMIRQALDDNHYDISSDDFTLVSFSFLPENDTKERKTLFMGELGEGLPEVVKKISTFIEEYLQNYSFAVQVENKLPVWLEENLVLKEVIDKEKRYLVKIEYLDYSRIKVTFWSQLLDMESSSGYSGKQLNDNLDDLHIKYQYRDLEDFRELNIILGWVSEE